MFCLVSRQSMANVLPVFMFKPKNVVLFATPEEEKSADNLQKLFHSKSISVKRIDGLNAYDFVNFKNIVSEQLNNSADETYLNITGGTKLMALAAYEVFVEKNKKIIYCDTEHKNIITLFPEVYANKIVANLSIEEYLLSYGYSILEKKDNFTIKKFYDLFIYVKESNSLISLVNLFRNVRKRFAENKPEFYVKSTDGKFLFQKNLDDYQLTFGLPPKKSIKISRSEFKFGDWLEYYTYYILNKNHNLSPYLGVKILSSQNIKNEIDLVVLKDYILYVFSCKSGKIDNQFDLYELETLRNVTSGTFGKGIFITANHHSEAFEERAKELSIKIINVLSTNIINL